LENQKAKGKSQKSKMKASSVLLLFEFCLLTFDFRPLFRLKPTQPKEKTNG